MRFMSFQSPRRGAAGPFALAASIGQLSDVFVDNIEDYIQPGQRVEAVASGEQFLGSRSHHDSPGAGHRETWRST